MIGNFVVSARDFGISNSVIHLRNGDIVIINYSVEHDSTPETKAVRAEMKAIVILKKLSDNKTEYSSIFNLDMKMKIPGFVQNKMANGQYEGLQKLKNAIEEY